MTVGTRRSGAFAIPLVVVAGLALLALLALAVLGVGARRGAPGDDDDVGSDVAPVTSTTAPTSPPRSGRDITSAVLGPVVVVERHGRPQAVGELRPDTVLQLRLRGFDRRTTVRVAQCSGGRCANAIRAHIGPNGNAALDYLVVDDVGGSGRCRIDAPVCRIVAEAFDGEGRAEITTVFEDALPPPGMLEVSPRTRLRDGDDIDVRVTGVLPGARLAVVVCSRPRHPGEERCRPAARRDVTTDEAGAVATSLAVDAPACTGDRRCEVTVRSGRAFVRATPVALSFASTPGVDYASGRVIGGLAFALALAGAALYLIRRTDWSPIGEEAAPEIDDAEYADLDAMVAALPPEDDAVLVENP